MGLGSLMPTQHLHRVILIVPATTIATFNTWVRNNLDPSGGDWITANLSATGSAPFTHGWCCAALTVPQLKKLAQRLCTFAGLTLPGDWDTLTKQQQKQWFADQRPAIFAATGIRVQSADNDGAWDDPAAALTAMGLQRQSSNP